MLDGFSSLTKGVSSATKSCADSGSGSNFCPESQCRKLNVQVEQCPERRYDYRDANNQPVVVVGEAILYVVLSGQVGRKYMRVLVTQVLVLPISYIGTSCPEEVGHCSCYFPPPTSGTWGGDGDNTGGGGA